MFKDRLMKLKITPKVLKAIIKIYVLGRAVPAETEVIDIIYNEKEQVYEATLQNKQFDEVEEGKEIPMFVNEPFDSVKWHENRNIERKQREEEAKKGK